MTLIPHTISRRLQLYIGCATCLVLAVTTWISYRTSRDALEHQTNVEALKQVQAAAARMDDFLLRVGLIPQTLAARQTAFGAEPDSALVPYLAQMLKELPEEEVYGLYLAFDNKKGTDPNAMPWVDRKSWPGTVTPRYDHKEGKPGWYQSARRTRGFHITDPYFDEGGSDIPIITLSTPALDQRGEFVGVAGVDLSLRRLQQIVDNIRLRASETHVRGRFDAEYAYLVSARGNILTHPESRLMLRKDSPGADVRTLEDGKFVARLVEGYARLEMNGEPRRVYWAATAMTGWKVVLNVRESSLTAPVTLLTKRLAGSGLVALLFMVLVVAIIARKVTKPLGELTGAAGAVESGKFQASSLDAMTRRRDELGGLARGFQTMAREIQTREKKLAEWNTNLERTVEQRTAELARALKQVASELAEAADYVRSLLPPPQNGEVKTQWRFIPSQQLGGDAFGYQWLDEKHFAVYLLDVCGHGVGAALLSISVMNVLRSQSLPGVDLREPAAVLGALNDRFPMENQNNMYFTMWYGVYNKDTAQLAYASGGHPPAVLVPDQAVPIAATLRTPGMVIGSQAGLKFSTGRCHVTPGSRLFIFSDGAYEVSRPDGSMLALDEFVAHLSEVAKHETSLDQTVAFARGLQGKQQFDDDFSIVRIDFLRAAASAIRHTVELRYDFAELERLHQEITSFLRAQSQSPKIINTVNLILEEMVTNVIKYARPAGAEQHILVTLDLTIGELTVTLVDNGPEFNPLDRPEVDTTVPIEERSIGGLGIHLVKKMVDHISYRRLDGKNQLTLVKKLTVDPVNPPTKTGK